MYRLPCLRNLADAARTAWRTLPIPVDDVTFWAVLRRGATVHPLRQASYTEAVSIARHPDNGHVVFPMVQAAADALEAAHPDFAVDGVMGEWRLERTSAMCGPRPLTLRLVQPLPLPQFVEAVSRPLPHGNPPWLADAFAELRGCSLPQLAALCTPSATAAAAATAGEADTVMDGY